MAGQTIDKLVGARIRQVRLKRGWHQLHLAQELSRLGLKCDNSTVSRIEAGDRPLKLADLVRVAVALSVAPVALLPADSADVDNDETDLLVESALPEVTARELSWWFTGGLAQSPLVEDQNFYMQNRPAHPLRRDNPQNRLPALIMAALLRADEALDRVPADTVTWARAAQEARDLLAVFFSAGNRVIAHASAQPPASH